MSNETRILNHLKQIAKKKSLDVSDRKLEEIAKSLSKTRATATKSKIKSKILLNDFSTKEAIDTGDVDYWIDQIAGIINKK